VLPKLEQLETKDWKLAREMVKVGAGPLGLLGVDVPEAYGGPASTKSPRSSSAKSLARAASFGATFAPTPTSPSSR